MNNKKILGHSHSQSIKPISYQPYILRKQNLNYQKNYEEDNSIDNLNNPEKPLLDRITQLQNTIDKLKNENQQQKNKLNLLYNNIYTPSNDLLKRTQSLNYRKKELLPYYNNQRNINKYDNNMRTLEDGINNLRNSYHNIKKSFERKMKELELKQQMRYEYLIDQLSQRNIFNSNNKYKKKIPDENLTYYVQKIIDEKQNSFEDRIKRKMNLENAINKKIEENLLDKYNNSLSIKQKILEQELRNRNLLNDLIYEKRDEIKNKSNSLILPSINDRDITREFEKFNEESNKRRLLIEEKNNQILKRIMDLQKNNEIKNMQKRLLQNQILQNNIMMNNQMNYDQMNYDYYQRPVRIIRRHHKPLRRKYRRRMESDFESDDESEENESEDEEYYKKKKKKNKENKKKIKSESQSKSKSKSKPKSNKSKSNSKNNSNSKSKQSKDKPKTPSVQNNNVQNTNNHKSEH